MCCVYTPVKHISTTYWRECCINSLSGHLRAGGREEELLPSPSPTPLSSSSYCHPPMALSTTLEFPNTGQSMFLVVLTCLAWQRSHGAPQEGTPSVVAPQSLSIWHRCCFWVLVQQHRPLGALLRWQRSNMRIRHPDVYEKIKV